MSGPYRAVTSTFSSAAFGNIYKKDNSFTVLSTTNKTKSASSLLDHRQHIAGSPPFLSGGFVAVFCVRNFNGETPSPSDAFKNVTTIQQGKLILYNRTLAYDQYKYINNLAK